MGIYSVLLLQLLNHIETNSWHPFTLTWHSLDPTLPAVAIRTTEGRDKLWGKTKAAFEYVHKHHLTDAEWFLKADADTFLILENLRALLSSHSSDKSLFLGCRFKRRGLLKGYMSGGAGRLLLS